MLEFVDIKTPFSSNQLETLDLLAAEFVDIGSGSAAGLTACTCGAIATFDVGFVTIGEVLR